MGKFHGIKLLYRKERKVEIQRFKKMPFNTQAVSLRSLRLCGKKVFL